MALDISCPGKLRFFFDTNYVRYRVAYGGRSSGKSWTAAQGLVIRSMQKKIRILCCREIQKSIKESVKKTLESTIERMGLAGAFTFKQDSIVCVNGSEFIFQGLHANVQQIKSLENISIAYVEEAETVTEESWQVLIPTIRADKSEIWVCFNPKDADDATYQRFVVNPPKDCISVKINYTDNPFCPDVMEAEAEDLKEKNLGLYRHIWLGECRQANENALWKAKSMIDPYRVQRCVVDLERIVVGVDPAVTNNEKSDETGIVCAGRARNRETGEYEYYVLDDWSMKGSPNEWAKRAIELYGEYDADRIVVEVNNGGDLVESLMRRIDSGISLSSVRATRGKILRAEPIAAMYERGLVHHVGVFPLLEDEMCNFCGTDGESSPDRLDALVWALTELSGDSCGEVGTGTFIRSF
ncbi:MAG: PBSX family phage terminase large subunit [Lentisphaeria bacterium]|nr:PBSX family phage terminase large subunit [Lentisphaeria bacterium]